MSKEEFKPDTVIDGTDAILGRLASYVAKQLLLGKKIAIVNCNNVIITGKPKSIQAAYLQKVKRGGSNFKGPYFPRQAFRIVKRTIRGMLPYRKERGQTAMDNIRCYDNAPAQFKNPTTIKTKIPQTTFITLEKLRELV
jgi:large subunit ribosomal protein L13